MFKVTNIIYIYLLIIFSLIFFNVWYSLKEKVINHLNAKGKIKYKKMLKDELKYLNDSGTVRKEHLKYLKFHLRSTNQLLIFEHAIKDLKAEATKTDKDTKNFLNQHNLNKYLDLIFPVFEGLIITYQKKDSIHKAYFASVLLLFPKRNLTKDHKLIDTLLYFVHDHSMYCRENALKFLYLNGDVTVVIDALMIVRENNFYYNSKILTDDLLSFQGDQTTLTEQLLANFDFFKSDMQVSIINYMRLIEMNFSKKLYDFYESHKYDEEVELAILRYYSRHKYPPIVPELLNILSVKNSETPEYSIIACTTLAHYDTAVSRLALINALSDDNWYIRKNAATSLSRMNLTVNDAKLINNLKDKYAKEMVNYIFKQKEKGK